MYLETDLALWLRSEPGPWQPPPVLFFPRPGHRYRLHGGGLQALASCSPGRTGWGPVAASVLSPLSLRSFPRACSSLGCPKRALQPRRGSEWVTSSSR